MNRWLPPLGRRGRGTRWRKRGVRPRVWAHRGASALVTENTLAAFEAARDAGADGVELDVRRCRTGEIVVFHDEDLWRLARRRDAVEALSFDEVRATELVGGHQIPTLAEVLTALVDLEVNVELKSVAVARGGPLAAATAQVIVDAGALDRVLVSSFDPVALIQIHHAVPELARAFLFHRGEPLPVRRGWPAPLAGASALHPEHVLCDQLTVEAWRRRGYAVNVWTVDDPERLRQLAAWGVDGVFANDPGAALKIFNEG